MQVFDRFDSVKLMSLNEIIAVKSFDISFHTTVFYIFADDNIVPYFLLTLLQWNTRKIIKILQK